MPAIAVALASTLAFALAHGTAWLFAARILSGCGRVLGAALFASEIGWNRY